MGVIVGVVVTVVVAGGCVLSGVAVIWLELPPSSLASASVSVADVVAGVVVDVVVVVVEVVVVVVGSGVAGGCVLSRFAVVVPAVVIVVVVEAMRVQTKFDW